MTDMQLKFMEVEPEAAISNINLMRQRDIQQNAWKDLLASIENKALMDKILTQDAREEWVYNQMLKDGVNPSWVDQQRAHRNRGAFDYRNPYLATTGPKRQDHYADIDAAAKLLNPLGNIVGGAAKLAGSLM